MLFKLAKPKVLGAAGVAAILVFEAPASARIRDGSAYDYHPSYSYRSPC